MHEEKRTRELPTGKYAVIYADPPWQYDNSGFNESADNQYPTMPLDEIWHHGGLSTKLTLLGSRSLAGAKAGI